MLPCGNKLTDSNKKTMEDSLLYLNQRKINLQQWTIYKTVNVQLLQATRPNDEKRCKVAVI